ncbi:MAG: ribosome small subunit-dependent GTPase A [Burkholderiaceae bacterium]
MSPAAPSADAADFDARVVATFGRQFLIEDDGGAVWTATRRGKKGDVVVGDRVRARASAPGLARIETLQARRSLLFRADGFRVKELAANIDLVLVVYAARPTFNRWFVWKALVAAHAAGIEAVVVQNKTDLDEDGEAAAFRRSLEKLGVTTLALSAKAESERTYTTLTAVVRDRASLLVGQSGMGKSTLLNLLVPDAGARTQEYSQRLDVGKQTTTASRWFDLPCGGSIVDTPGFQEFGLDNVPLDQLAESFPEFRPGLGHCRFQDCRHLVEPDCALRELVDQGAVAADRFAFYRSLAEARPL